MALFEIRDPLPGDVEEIASNLRQSDRREIWAASRLTPLEGLRVAAARSPDIWVGTVDGKPIGMAGAFAGSLLGSVGYPWQLSTPEIDKVAIPYLRSSRIYFEAIRCRYELLCNWVDARNTKSIRWMKYLGFHFDPARPWGVDGLPFHYAWIKGG